MCIPDFAASLSQHRRSDSASISFRLWDCCLCFTRPCQPLSRPCRPCCWSLLLPKTLLTSICTVCLEPPGLAGNREIVRVSGSKVQISSSKSYLRVTGQFWRGLCDYRVFLPG